MSSSFHLLLSIMCLQVVLSLVTGHMNETQYSSPSCSQPWTFRNASEECECGVTIPNVVTVECSENGSLVTELQLMNGYCMTYSFTDSITYVGLCPYSSILDYTSRYVKQTLNSTELNEGTCGKWNREGKLCSKCRKGFGVPLYSYSFQCVNCSYTERHKKKEMAVLLIKAFLPLTVMCIGITLFHINVLLPPWNMFVLANQVFSALPLMQAIYSRAIIVNSTSRKIGVEIIATIYGPWNLDFFRALYTPTCISPHATNIHASVLDGLIGLYPLVLLIMIYFVVKLHDRGCVVVVKLWRPFYICLARFRKHLDLKSSLIHSFSTFILLSYTKLGIALFYILVPTNVMTPKEGKDFEFVYIQPSLKYFSGPHLIYGVVTLALGVVFLILPMVLLCLYPYRCFQQCLNNFSQRSLALHAFVDAFQGCYKDGTNGTKDCRYFSVLHFLLRFKILLLFGITQKPVVYAFLGTIIFIGFIFTFAITKPYKKEIYNRADLLLLMSMLLVNVMIVFHETKFLNPYADLRYVIIASSVIFPLVYLIAWMIIWCKRQCCCKAMKNSRRLLSSLASTSGPYYS